MEARVGIQMISQEVKKTWARIYHWIYKRMFLSLEDIFEIGESKFEQRFNTMTELDEFKVRMVRSKRKEYKVDLFEQC